MLSPGPGLLILTKLTIPATFYLLSNKTILPSNKEWSKVFVVPVEESPEFLRSDGERGGRVQLLFRQLRQVLRVEVGTQLKKNIIIQ